MQYLAPDETHTITVPIIVGAEYATPTQDGKLKVRIDGVTTQSIITKQDSTSLSYEITTPSVLSGTLKIITVEASILTALGVFKTRNSFGVVDSLDIPTECNDVRNLLGLNEFELSDEDINLEGFYVDCYQLMINDFHIVRQSDPYYNKKFGEFIAITAASANAAQLHIKLDKKRSTENGDVTRLMDSKYFSTYLDALSEKMISVTSTLSEYLTQETITANTLAFAAPPQYSLGDS